MRYKCGNIGHPSVLNCRKLSLTSLGLEAETKTGRKFLFTCVVLEITGCEAILIILFLLLFGEGGVLEIHKGLYFRIVLLNNCAHLSACAASVRSFIFRLERKFGLEITINHHAETHNALADT